MEEPDKKQRRWYFYGCSTLIILTLLLGILGVLYMIYFKKAKPAISNPQAPPPAITNINSTN